MPNGPDIAVINASTVVNDQQVQAASAAMQIQMSRDFAPVWGLDATIHCLSKGQNPAADWWQVIILDNSDQAGALGYHYLTATGLPLGKVFAKTNIDQGTSWTVSFSHETVEMRADQNINLLVQLDETRFASYEDADPVESDADGYLIGDVLVSNFVLPSYFTPGSKGPWDFRNLLTGPMPTLRPDGYLAVYVVGQGWTQINSATSDKVRMQSIASIGSRRQRRMTPRSEWIRSTR